MSTSHAPYDEPIPEVAWRNEAPRARAAAMVIFSWREPGWSFLWAIAAALLFAAAAVFSPALLSLTPTVDMIAPIAEARAVLAGEAKLVEHDTPFFLMLLMGADIFVDAPGRVHLIAKALGAVLVLYPLAYLCASRFPAVFSASVTGALAAYAAAPFSGPAELGLAIFLVSILSFVSVSADESKGRAWFEGALGGSGLIALWMMNPVFALVGFAALAACPFLTGRFGLQRYAAAFAVFVLLAIAIEIMAPGMNAARAGAASDVLNMKDVVTGGESALGLGGAAYGALLVIFSAMIFGGRAHRRNWAAALGLMIAGLVAARIAGANALPVFALAAGLACFSVASPFYDGLFRDHDRASVATALTAAGLTLFWTLAIAVHAMGQFSLQYSAAKNAPEDIRTELALVQPGGPTIAKWVEEGRFSTPEARDFFALTPVDQSAMLLEAASRARTLAEQGLDVAFLTGADTACVITTKRDCHADGPAAASNANVVFVPRLDMDPKTAAAKGRSEALLYTEFKMVERTALWDIWVRRDLQSQSNLFPTADASLYR
ncbi:hypothetical protein PUV54_02675 [Hyphococcus flavus]|uniref:Uncharacterized protein n=1 Tax=Hyphococcus flavus TaxID=1866326 RepID=A0AAE9ZC85_9PROT|nr:hypothetical protein [Hyphococcus flavus]WDI32094.1 hypothetical protein PUV54_02675 [Hyphococcus flavus]